MNTKRFLLSALIATVVAGSPMTASAASQLDDGPTGAGIVFDLLIARPLGLVGLIAGAGVFALTIPFSIFTGEPPIDPAKRLVLEPLKFTFFRPLGESPGR